MINRVNKCHILKFLSYLYSFTNTLTNIIISAILCCANAEKYHKICKIKASFQCKHANINI